MKNSSITIATKGESENLFFNEVMKGIGNINSVLRSLSLFF